jgi:hypothetical protein
MLRSKTTGHGLACGAVVAVALTLAGCGGGGSSGGSSTAAAFNPPRAYASFTAYTAGATSTTFLFQDQAVLFDFGQPVEANQFGGLYASTPGAAPDVFTAVSVVPTGLQYNAFANQTAARAAFQVFSNTAGALQYPSYIVGRHATQPNILVIDPLVFATNPFGLPASPGFAGPLPPGAGQPVPAPFEYVYVIPTGALQVGGQAYAGTGTTGPNPFNLPFPLNAFGTTYASTQYGFAIGPGTGPDPIPPRVDSVIPMNRVTGQPGVYTPVAGTAQNPLLTDGVIKIVFSKKVSRSSIDALTNLRIRNLNILQQGVPTLIPGTFDRIDPVSNAVQTVDTAALLFTPTGGSFGPGVNSTTGYNIEVRVGTNSDPNIPAILGTPQGTAGTQLPLENTLTQTVTTAPCTLGVTPGCLPPVATIAEGFDNVAKLDSAFAGTWVTARWNNANDPGKLSGRLMSGSPTGNNTTALGTRVQITVNPTPLGTTPTGLFSPWDASLAGTTACGANCGATGCNLGVNPGGGSHIMHLFEAVDLANTKDALEYVEWAPVGQVTTPTVYPTVSMWCGLTSLTGPFSGTVPASPNNPGLLSAYGANYGALATGLPGTNTIPFQSNDPTVFEVIAASQGGNGTNGRVRVFGPANFSLQSIFSQFVGYPLFNPPFDFANSNGGSGTGNNLVFEMNVESGAQCPNFHRYKATAATPVRRIIGPPLSLVAPGNTAIASTGGFDIYLSRFTFVGRRSSVRSLWYDTGALNPNYLQMVLDPSPVPNPTGGVDPLLQPAGTQSVWRLDGQVTGASLPLPSVIGTVSQALVFDAAGAFQSSALTSLTAGNCRFFRFRVEMLGNATANTVPSFNNLLMVFNPINPLP